MLDFFNGFSKEDKHLLKRSESSKLIVEALSKYRLSLMEEVGEGALLNPDRCHQEMIITIGKIVVLGDIIYELTRKEEQ